MSVTQRFQVVWERLRTRGFSIEGIGPDHVCVLRYALEGQLRQTIQAVSDSSQKPSIVLSASIDVLERIRGEPPNEAATYPLDSTDPYLVLKMAK